MYTEEQIRKAWDLALAGVSIDAEIASSFESYSFQEFMKKLKEIATKKTPKKASE